MTEQKLEGFTAEQWNEIPDTQPFETETPTGVRRSLRGCILVLLASVLIWAGTLIVILLVLTRMFT